MKENDILALLDTIEGQVADLSNYSNSNNGSVSRDKLVDRLKLKYAEL